MTRLRRIVTGLAALGALAALLVAVPWALCHFIGWPLPHRLPSWSGLGHDLNQRGIPDKTLVDALAVVVWMIWAALAVSILVEVASTVRGERARRVPIAGLFQPLTGRLVAAVLVAVLTLAPRGAVHTNNGAVLAAIAHRPAATVVLTDIEFPGSSAPDLARAPSIPAAVLPVPLATLSATQGPARTERATPTRTYVVQRGDTLWGIAERELGDPLRWRQIAQLNEDRREGQSRLGDPHWIYPGWTLLLPAELAESARPTAPIATREAVHADGSGSALPLTDHHHASQSTPRSLAPSPTTQPSTTQPTMIEPARTEPPQPTAPDVPASTHGQAGEEFHQQPVAEGPAPLPVVPIGAGLLGIGVLGLLTGLRRVQQRHRRAGHRIALPTGALADVERQLAAGADRNAATTLDRALRLLGSVCHEQHLAPTILGLVLTPDRVLFHLQESLSAPSPFTDGEDGTWILDLRDPASERALGAAAEEASLLPGFVTIGEEDGALVLLNLESGGSIAIAGDADVAAEVATAIALELAGASWVERAELCDVGVGTGQANPYRCTTLGSLSDALDLARQRSEAMARELDASGKRSAAAARLTSPDQDWAPLLVVSSDPPTPEQAAILATIASPETKGLAFVAPGAFAARWTLAAHANGTLDVPMLGQQVRAQRVSRRHLAGIAAVLGLAASRVDVTPDEAPYDAIQSPGVPVAKFSDDEPFTEAFPERGDDGGRSSTLAEPQPLFGDGGDSDTPVDDEPPAERRVRHEELRLIEGDPVTAEALATPQVEVSVLGPIELHGLTGELTRRKSVQLLAWLVLHPGGGSQEVVKTALWPKGDCSDRTFWNYRWEVRRALGNTPDGEPLLPARGDLALRPEVATDWAHFRALVAKGDRSSRGEALSLVRGRPAGDEDWIWLTTEGIMAAIESEVADIAYELGEEELDRGEYEAAAQAAAQGILISPYDERLYGILMRAANAAGNPAAVRAVMHRLSAALEDDIEPFETVHPETRALYESLLARPVPRPPEPERSHDTDVESLIRHRS
jgi:DNA-binding SARP family transcriptional activator